MRLEVGAIRYGHIAWDRLQYARRQRPSIAIADQDGLKLRHRIDDLLQPQMQTLLVRGDLIVGHVADDLLDLSDRPFTSLENLERMFVQNIERPVDPVVGHLVLVPVADPGGEYEEHRRQHQRGDHHQLENADSRLPGCAHGVISWLSGPHATRFCRSYYAGNGRQCGVNCWFRDQRSDSIRPKFVSN